MFQGMTIQLVPGAIAHLYSTACQTRQVSKLDYFGLLAARCDLEIGEEERSMIYTILTSVQQGNIVMI